MNPQFTTRPHTRAEAEQTVKTTIHELIQAWNTGPQSADTLTDQYVRVLSARLWHDVARWRVEELALKTIDLDNAHRDANTHDAHILTDVTNALTNELVAYRAWPKAQVAA